MNPFNARRLETMAIYCKKDYERVAAAIGKDVAEVMRHEKLFERAAHWYKLDCGLPHDTPPRPRPTPPTKMREKMHLIAKSARRLLKHLGVDHYDEAFDGPGNFEILEVLASVEEPSEDAVVIATRRIGRLEEILQAIEAADELEHRARKAADEVIAVGDLTVPRGNRGDAAVNNWVASMMEIYRKITGSEPATSVGRPDQPNEGIASGPLIRFLEAAGKPVEITYAEDAWRSRVRTILKPQKN